MELEWSKGGSVPWRTRSWAQGRAATGPGAGSGSGWRIRGTGGVKDRLQRRCEARGTVTVGLGKVPHYLRAVSGSGDIVWHCVQSCSCTVPLEQWCSLFQTQEQWEKVTFPKIAGMSKPRFYFLTFPDPIKRSPFTEVACASCLAPEAWAACGTQHGAAAITASQTWIWALEPGLVHNSLVWLFKKPSALSCVSHTLLTQLNCLFFHLSSALVLTKGF